MFQDSEIFEFIIKKHSTPSDLQKLRLVSHNLFEKCHAAHFGKIPFFRLALSERVRTLNILDFCENKIRNAVLTPAEARGYLKLLYKSFIAVGHLDLVKDIVGLHLPFAPVGARSPWQLTRLLLVTSNAKLQDFQNIDLSHVTDVRNAGINCALFLRLRKNLKNLARLHFRGFGENGDLIPVDCFSDLPNLMQLELEGCLFQDGFAFPKRLQKLVLKNGYSEQYSDLDLDSLTELKHLELHEFVETEDMVANVPDTLETLKLVNYRVTLEHFDRILRFKKLKTLSVTVNFCGESPLFGLNLATHVENLTIESLTLDFQSDRDLLKLDLAKFRALRHLEIRMHRALPLSLR